MQRLASLRRDHQRYKTSDLTHLVVDRQTDALPPPVVLLWPRGIRAIVHATNANRKAHHSRLRSYAVLIGQKGVGGMILSMMMMKENDASRSRVPRAGYQTRRSNTKKALDL